MMPNLPEAQLIENLWRGNKMQPITAAPKVNYSNGKVSITCDTEGASIAYKIKINNGMLPKSWKIYQNPFEIPKDAELLVQAHRIGFVASKVIKLSELQ